MGHSFCGHIKLEIAGLNKVIFSSCPASCNLQFAGVHCKCPSMCRDLTDTESVPKGKRALTGEPEFLVERCLKSGSISESFKLKYVWLQLSSSIGKMIRMAALTLPLHLFILLSIFSHN